MDYETIPAGWNSSRRCGYIFFSYRFLPSAGWYGLIADQSGHYKYGPDQRCNCPTMFGEYSTSVPSSKGNYTAVCQDDGWVSSFSYKDGFNTASSAYWVRNNTCPKGWGKYNDAPESRTEPYVQCAQGYVPTGYKEPIYGYVTRYRDAWYNYYSTRVAKS